MAERTEESTQYAHSGLSNSEALEGGRQMEGNLLTFRGVLWYNQGSSEGGSEGYMIDSPRTTAWAPTAPPGDLL